MKIYEFNVNISLPEKLKSLEKIAYNLWWSWDVEARRLFRTINKDVWDSSEHNPVAVLQSLTKEDHRRILNDAVLMSMIDDVSDKLDEYLNLPKWFDVYHSDLKNDGFLVAYFSAEYGIHESLKLYSGGLGILSGDHCKSASDIGLPFVAVGLLYREGYFHQYLNSDGWQQESMPYNEFYSMPVKRVKDENGFDQSVSVRIADREVNVHIWEMALGTIRIIFLDTDCIENHPEDRKITGQLYGGDTTMRLKQEIVLGVAGFRAISKIGIKPTNFHMNEGHPSFLTLERMRQLVEKEKLDLRTAAEVVKKSTLFTTHTPVPAGFDVFGTDQVKKYLGPLFEGCGFNVNQLMGFGRKNPFDDNEGFAMALCGLKLSTFRNGVSDLHGEVSRNMFKEMWPNALEKYIPVGHVTNGVHLPTFISNDIKVLYTRYLGDNWSIKPYDFSVWEKADIIPDGPLFDAKRRQRESLVNFTRKRLKKQILKRGGGTNELLKSAEVLNPDCLTIGFARRFATYKRAYLLFLNEKKLSELLNNEKMPVQIIIAGKAHPKDNGGKDIIKQIIHICRKPEFRDKIVFIEDYDIEVGRHLAHGVDIWLNTPRRPMEASGTSGMKIASNGGLNFSILDGWWDEGFNGSNGWAIGAGEQYDNEKYQDYVESMELYDKLESEIIPLFYMRDKNGIPREWMKMMKEAIKTCPSFFNTSRMVMEYTEKYYIPLHTLACDFVSENFDQAKKFLEWKENIISGWDGVNIINTSVETTKLEMGSKLVLTADVETKTVHHSHISICAAIEYEGVSGNLTAPDLVKMDYKGENDGKHIYTLEEPLKRAGKLKVGFAAIPEHKFIKELFDLNLVKWA